MHNQERRERQGVWIGGERDGGGGFTKPAGGWEFAKPFLFSFFLQLAFLLFSSIHLRLYPQSDGVSIAMMALPFFSSFPFLFFFIFFFPAGF